MKFGALWIGNQLTEAQKLCLNSFIYYGHEVTLFVYDNNIAVPDGIVKEDARKILPENKIFIHMGSYAGFSDIFRVYMIKKTGYTWTDVDMMCLSSDWNFGTKFIFGKGYDGDNHINPGILSIPQNHEVVDDMIYSIENNAFRSDDWIGYMLVVTESLKKFNLFNLFQNAETFSPIDWTEVDVLYKPEKFDYVMSKISKSKSMAIYNSALNNMGIDQNIFPEGSAIRYFYEYFLKGDKI